MCGRYLIDDESDSDIFLRYSLGVAKPDFSVGEIFPTNIAPVIIQTGATVAKWGFPHWSNGSSIINARSETAHEKNMFKKPLKQSRCVVLSNGFYEWGASVSSKKKDKFLFRLPDEKLLCMAGLMNTFRDTEGDEYLAFVILTTDANDSVEDVHNRMPVILAHDEEELWLSDDTFSDYLFLRSGPVLTKALV